jgi:hypothetical protein
MLKIRGNQEEINRLLRIVEKEQKQNNAAMCKFEGLKI